MDFDFSQDQDQLRDAVRKWVDKGYGLERRRAIAAGGGFSAEAYRELADLGLCGLNIPEQHGGLGMGPIEAMVVMEELGRGIVLEPLAQALIAGAVLCQHAPAALAQRWAPLIAGGEKIVSLAWQEQASRYRLAPCASTSIRQGDGWSLTGRKGVVVAGGKADAWIVGAMADGRLGAFLVERGAAGATTRDYGTLAGGCAAELQLQGTPAQLMSADGQAVLEHAIDIGIAASCAEAVGVMERTLEITVEYLNTRKQFGVLIGSFQALRHRVADMKMQLELARSMSYYASLKLDAPAAERRVAMARAKYQLGQSMRFVGQQAIQLHGGIGMTDEYSVGHYFKRLTELEIVFGDSLHQLGEVASRMQESAGVYA